MLQVLAGLLEPMVDDRMRAREALGILEGKLAAARCAPLHSPCVGQDIIIQDVPPWGLGTRGMTRLPAS